MPNLDGTGPRGRGPLTGRGLGPCGRGRARSRAPKRGFAFRRGGRFGRAPLRGRNDYAYRNKPRNTRFTEEEEKEMIKQELEELKKEREDLEKRLEELGG
ncbi:MAG: DUF5320 domain-containing protein [Candidatus Nanohaloarchaeota archaeon QJJ-9]|nr:DUF5320 domain-containing protein [Candidatus Nanohaloarchaeota archaeon QJJ-9]